MIKDPEMLLSFINTKLRDFYKSLDCLCDDLNYDKDEIIAILQKIDYYYDDKSNRFISEVQNEKD